MHRLVDVVWLRLIAVPRCRFDMTVGRQDADVADQHHHGEKKNTQPGHYEAVSRQPHYKDCTRFSPCRHCFTAQAASASPGAAGSIEVVAARVAELIKQLYPD